MFDAVLRVRCCVPTLHNAGRESVSHLRLRGGVVALVGLVVVYLMLCRSGYGCPTLPSTNKVTRLNKRAVGRLMQKSLESRGGESAEGAS